MDGRMDGRMDGWIFLQWSSRSPAGFKPNPFHYSKLITCESVWIRSLWLLPRAEWRGERGERGGMWGTAGRRGERRDRGAEVVFVWRACTESSLCFNTAGNQRLVFTEQTVFIIIIIIIVITRIFSALTASSNVLLPMDFSWKQCSVLLLLLFAVKGKTPRGVGQRGTRKKHAQYFTLNMPLSD